MSAPLDEMLVLLRRIADGIERLVPLHEPDNVRLTKKEVAATLGVSTRWVERHLVPTDQVVGGKSWYLRDDVEAQLARLNGASGRRVQRSAHAAAPAATRRRRRKHPPPPERASDHSNASRVAEIEQRLRRDTDESR